jgi:hypothetical protein
MRLTAAVVGAALVLGACASAEAPTARVVPDLMTTITDDRETADAVCAALAGPSTQLYARGGCWMPDLRWRIVPRVRRPAL